MIEKKEKTLRQVYFLLISLLVVVTTFSKVEGADWYNSAWNYCKKISIDHTKVPNSDQSNFPVLISRTDTDWKDTGNGGHIGQSDGGDILFTASNGTTKLSHEIEKYEPSTGRLSVWVKVPNLSHTTDTEIYIYYGNAGCSDQWDINGTWDEDYKMVQHFQESCAAGNCHLDSTSNNNNGTPYSNTTITNLHTDSGKIEGGDIFDGYDDYVDCGNNASLNISDVITIGAWVKKSPLIGIAITNCQELQNIKNNLSGDYYLANDIDCSDTVNWNGGEGFRPINSFEGTLDGRGYRITDLYINTPSSDDVGLFGITSSGSEIKDVGLENVNITAYDNVGALAGNVYSGSIINCYSTGSVNARCFVGGLIGYLYRGEVTNCYSLSIATGRSYIGSLIGWSREGTIINSFAKGNVFGISPTGSASGGLIGYSLICDIIDCYATGNVNVHATFQQVGGLVGDNKDGFINRCYSTGNVTGGFYAIGGFVGLNRGTIGDSYWDIETSGKNNMCGHQDAGASGCNNSYGKTTAEMKQKATFAGWDFINTWSIEEGITYPFLQWPWDCLISKGKDAYSLQMDGNGSILYGHINNNEIITSLSSPAQWNHYAITFDGTDQKLFVNGDLKKTSNIGGTIGINGNNVTIGGLRRCFNGAIDEVRISNKARSEDWIKTSYNNQNDPASFYNIGGEVVGYLADNHIKNSAEGIYIGNNIYNTDGSNQTKVQNVDNGATAIYHIRIQNDGNIADTFTVTGTGGAANWIVTYYDALVAGSNITANVTGSGWSSGALNSGGTKEIRVEVTPGAGAGGGTSREILITSTSQGDGNADAVKATTTVTSDYQTDNHIKNSAEGTYIGNNIYNTDGSNQTKAQNVDNGITAIYHIRIQNDGNIADTFTVTGTGGAANWIVTYYDALVAGSNITANVTGSGWSSGALVSGGTKEIRVEVTPGAGAGGGTSREILIISTSQGDGNADAVKTTTTVNSDYQTDNHIKNSGEGTYIGNNIYNTDGSNQTKAQNVDNGATAIYHIRIQNDGNIADTFTVTGTGGAANWIVTYYDALVAGSNITANVTGSGWSSGALNSGGTKEIRVEVTPGAGAGGGTSREILITSTSQGDGNADAVKATTTVTSDYQTDNHIKNSAEGTYIGNNIYNTDGSNQTKAQNVDNGATAIYHIRIQNDGNIADTFTVTGTGGDANWIVTYYDALVAGSNITANVTGSGWSSGALNSGGTKEIRVEVTPGAGAGGGTSREILITSASQGDGNADAVKATTTVTSDYQTDNHIKNSGEGTYIGNNIYNTDGSNQTKAQNVDNGITAIYHIRIENDGNIADTFTVTGTGGDANWIVTYYDALVAGSNITANVTGSGWSSGALVSGGTKEIRVEVTPGAGAGGGTSREILITSTSQGDGNADAVKAVTTVGSISNYCVDNQIKNSGETSYLGNGIYNLNGADQTAEQEVENNQTAAYYIKVENDGSLPDTFTITGTAGDVNWTIVYYDALSGGNNITSNITSSGWSTGSLASGGIKEIRVEVTPGGGVGDGLIKEVLINSQSVGDTNKEDVVKAITTCISVDMPYIKIETNADGTGSEVDSQTINSEDSLIVYAVHRDTSGVYVANVEASWGLIEKTRGAVDADLKPALDNKSATFTGHRVGTAKIKAEHTTLRDDSTGMITVVAGNPTHIRIVDNEGRDINTKAIEVGDSFTVYAMSKDTNENYVEDVAVTWSLIEKVGDIVDSDLVSALNNRSATFKGKGIGKAKIKACHSSLGDDETGDISVRISKTVFHPVYPNPFRLRKDGTVIFQYDLAEDVSSIGIEIYTLAGDLVRKWSGNTRRGRHRIFWDATNQGGRMVSSGMYFIGVPSKA